MKFVADVMLGRLARLMRFEGYDVEYDNTATDEELKRKSRYRLLLTKDRPLSRSVLRKNVCLIQGTGTQDQLSEIRSRFPLQKNARVRCLICNIALRRVRKRSVEHLVPPFVFQRCTDFYLCSNCRRIYWKGTHHTRLSAK